jgi:hypothetical protein
MRLRSEVEMDEGEERARMQILWKGKAEVGVGILSFASHYVSREIRGEAASKRSS